MKETLTSLAARIARHSLSAAGAFLASKGVINQSGQIALTNLAEVLAGIAIFALGILWSWLSDKFKFKK